MRLFSRINVPGPIPSWDSRITSKRMNIIWPFAVVCWVARTSSPLPSSHTSRPVLLINAWLPSTGIGSASIPMLNSVPLGRRPQSSSEILISGIGVTSVGDITWPTSIGSSWPSSSTWIGSTMQAATTLVLSVARSVAALPLTPTSRSAPSKSASKPARMLT